MEGKGYYMRGFYKEGEANKYAGAGVMITCNTNPLDKYGGVERKALDKRAYAIEMS
jgi:hypothetical protein